MRADSFPEIEWIFSEALEKPTRDHRAAFLEESCAENPSMRLRVEALLQAHERAGSFLTSPMFELTAEEFLSGEMPVAADSTRFDPTLGRSGEDYSFLEAPETPGEIGRFAGYSVIQVLGRGGAGIVLKARDERLERTVAIKVLAPEWAAQPRARERFLREARAAASVRHENVVAIHAVDETATFPFLVLEYIQGPTLQDRLREQSRLAPSEVVEISRQVVSGLAAAHRERLIHRDIKPANILIEEATGKVKLTDFGLARAADDARLTQEGVIAGTPQYMSPEQAQGKPIDPRSDLFSLGSVMYALCAGHPPFRAATTVAVLRALCDETPAPLQTVCPETPPGLARLIHNLLRKDPEHRPQTADEVLEQLDKALEEDDGDSPSGSSPPRKRARRVAAFLFLPAAVASLAYAIWKPEAAERLGQNDNSKNIAPGPRPNPKIPAAEGLQNAAKPSSEIRTPQKPENQPGTPHPLNLFEDSVRPFAEIRRMTVPGEQLYGLAVSSDGSRIYATATDKVIYCWSTDDGEELLRMAGHTGMTQHITLSPDGTRLVSCGGDRTLRLWNTETGNEIAQMSSPVPIRSAMFSPDGRELVINFYGGGTGRRIVELHRRDASPTHTKALVPHLDEVNVFDAATFQPLRSFRPPEPAEFFDVAWSPDGRYIAAGTNAGQVIVFDTAGETAPKVMRASAVPGPAHGIHFSQDGKQLYAAGSGNLVWCWNWPSGTVAFSRRFQHGVVRFALSTDGRWLGIGGALEVRLWSLQDPQGRGVLYKLEGHTSPIRNVAFVPGHNVLVSCAWDGSVRLWRLPAPPQAASE